MRHLESAYLPHGQLIDDRPDRPDKTSEEREAERRADRIAHRDVLALFRWSATDFERAQRFGFPKPLTSILRTDGSTESLYSKTRIEEWRTSLVAFAKGLR